MTNRKKYLVAYNDLLATCTNLAQIIAEDSVLRLVEVPNKEALTQEELEELRQISGQMVKLVLRIGVVAEGQSQRRGEN